MKPEWWTNGKACSRIPRVIEIWREQGCEATPLYSGAALLDAHQRGMEEAATLLHDHATVSNGEFLDPAVPDILAAIRAKAEEVEP